MAGLLNDLRNALAEQGLEFTVHQVDEILQHGAHIASLVGGYLLMDMADGYGIEIELLEGDDAAVQLVWYEVDDVSDEEFN